MFQISRLIVKPKPGRSRHRGVLTAGHLRYPCSLGRSGIGINKLEGDGKTPIGVFPLVTGYYRADHVRLPRCSLPFTQTRRRDGWCDSPTDPNYNRPVTLPFGESHERMHREDRLYDLCVVLDYNLFPRRRFRGSAIFLHLQREDRGPTEGCVALRPGDFIKLLPRLAPHAVLEVKSA